MPFTNVNIHFVWSTKNRIPYLHSKNLRMTVWDHIQENAKKKKIWIDTINGYHDHSHALIFLEFNQTMSQIMQLIKGESSFWINKNKLCRNKFEWQEEYYAVSVSPSQLDQVREYIRNQEEHHRHKSFQEEFDQFISKCGFQKFSDGSIKTVGALASREERFSFE
ncbi:MAG TPA: IS200/IS605 family transposase [Chryseosolibacter sp.]|nr:IS200/IS605 family transposase [Chryseosolibacter sp.]